MHRSPDPILRGQVAVFPLPLLIRSTLRIIRRVVIPRTVPIFMALTALLFCFTPPSALGMQRVGGTASSDGQRTALEDADGRRVRIRGDRLSGFVLPIEPLPGAITIQSLRADAWKVDDTQRLQVEGDVQISIAGQRFRAPAAAVWINRIPSQWGTINQIAVFFDEVSNPSRQAGTGVSGRHVLVTGSTIGEVELEAVRVEHDRPHPTALLRRGEARLADHLRRIAGDPPPLAQWPKAEHPEEPEPYRPEPGRRFRPEQIEWPEEIELPEPEPTSWLVPPTGTVRYSAADVEIVPGEEENTITMIGPLVIEYIAGDLADQWERITITAERGVIFTDPGTLEAYVSGQHSAESVRGVYLEGNVIVRADDEYTVRSPRVYYDFRTDQAIMVDAILRTYSREHDLLMYSRAEEMRQLSENQWEARQVRVSTSEFYTPHIAVGARKATITQRPSRREPGATETHIDSRDLTLRAGGMPFFYWPRFSGTLRETPLKSVTFGTRRQDGMSVETTWNLFSLLGIEPEEQIQADLKIDGFSKRGAGAGTEFRYNIGRSHGMLDLYGLWDDGIDRVDTGVDVDPDRTFRGLALWEHHARFGQHWTFQGQASYISDPTFVSSRREEDFRSRREYETSAYLKHQQDNAALTILGKLELNDFISNDYLLASRQFQVDKLPEVTYRRYGDSLIGDLLTYSTETRLSRMRMVFNRTTPAEIGLRRGALGLDRDDPIDELLRSRGLHQGFVYRADTRHELSMPFEWSIFRIVPFVVGRFTAYDDDFEAFHPDTDKLRFYGAGGVTIGTQFQRVYDGVQSRLLNLNRLRHIVEPSMTLWYADTNVSGINLPVYDPEVEALADGAAMRFGMRNTLQTQRGGPGRWESVDVVTLDTHVVLHSSDADRRSPTPQFFDFRPEFSQPGDHFFSAAKWMLSDTVSLVGQGTYDFDNSVLSRGSAGAELRHSPVLTSYIEYRFIDISNTELLEVGWDYQLTPKYRVRLSPQWDFRQGDFRAITARVTRRFPDINLIFFLRYDQIRDETSIGATLGAVEF